MKTKVEAAIQAARNGDGEPLAAVPALGAEAVPFLATHLADSDAGIRRLVVSTLSAIGGRSAAEAVVAALQDEDADIRERAAGALHAFERPDEILSNAGNAHALRASVEAGNDTAGAVLLLGYAAGPDSLTLLQKLRQSPPERRTKLNAWSEPVSVALVATAAASRQGDTEARQSLLAALDKGSLETTTFLLSVARDIDDPPTLQALARRLNDEREIRGGVPSGATPSRRVCDAVADALVDRLRLPVKFSRNPARRYSAAEIDEVRQAIRASIPS